MENKIKIESEALDSLKDEFLNIISHEIRTALNGISGPVDLLKARIDAEKNSNLLTILDASISRLERFSITALRITELKTQKKSASKDIVKLHDLILAARNNLNDILFYKKVKIHIYPIPADLCLNGDMSILTVCIESILENAIRHSPDNSMIFIQSKSVPDYVVCEITDYGQGFSEKAQNNLFQLFCMGEPYNGNNLGLDLALCKLIMEVHGGKIEAENIKSRGALIRLCFPVVNDC